VRCSLQVGCRFGAVYAVRACSVVPRASAPPTAVGSAADSSCALRSRVAAGGWPDEFGRSFDVT